MLGGCWWLKGSRKPEKEIKQKDKSLTPQPSVELQKKTTQKIEL